MKSIFILFLSFVLGSCIVIVVYGRTNDYDKLTETQKSNIIHYAEGKSLDPRKVYAINAQELLTELKKQPKSLVYIFVNGCSSETCYPMAVYEEYARTHNLKLFLVMTGFAHLSETTDQPFQGPLFAIDGDFYKKEKRSVYTRYFENELQGLPVEHKARDYKGGLYFFSGNQLDTICRELPK